MKPFHVALFFSLLFVLPCGAHALTLEEGLAVIARSGRDVKIARSGEEAARSGVSLARSPRLPRLDLHADETWLRYEPAAKAPFGSFPLSQDRFLSYGLRARQMLYDFGKTAASINAAEYTLVAREAETRRARNRSALEFIIAYYGLLEAEKLLQVAGEEVRQYEAHKKDAEIRFGAGVVTRNEVLQADVKLADARQRCLTAENLRSLRASRINSLLLRPLNDPVQPEEVGKTPSAGITLEDAWTVALAESPEIRAIEADLRAREESIRAVRAEYLPSLSLSGGFEYQENEHRVHPRNWSVIAGVNLNLFSGGATAAKVHAGLSGLAALRTTRDRIVDAVRLEVKEAHLNLQSSAQQIEVTKTSVAQAEENLRLQRLRYKEGAGTATEVIDAVTLLASTRTSTWNARYAFERAEAGLLYAIGRDLTGIYGAESSAPAAYPD